MPTRAGQQPKLVQAVGKLSQMPELLKGSNARDDLVMNLGLIYGRTNLFRAVAKAADFINTSLLHKNSLRMELVKHTGGCHCGAVGFEVWGSPDLYVFHCNCSICEKKQHHHFIVPGKHFKLLQGSDNLTTYTFNTHVAKHTFCKTCGVQSFSIPRSNPDGYGIAPHCLDPGTVRSVTVEKFDGVNWEETMQAHKSIRNMSVDTADVQ